MSSRKMNTRGYGNDGHLKGESGVQITIRFPASVYSRLNMARKALKINDFRDVFIRAIVEYQRVITLVSSGNTICAGEDFHQGDIDLGLGVETEYFFDDEDVQVIAEMQPRFKPEELKLLLSIQKLFEKSAAIEISVDEIIEQSIAVLIWMVSKRLAGKKVFASQKNVKNAVKLPLDPETFFILRRSTK